MSQPAAQAIPLPKLKKLKPPNGRTLFFALWFTSAFAWIAYATIKISQGSYWRVLLLGIWIFGYIQIRDLRKHERRIEPDDTALPPVPRTTWQFLALNWACLIACWTTLLIP